MSVVLEKSIGDRIVDIVIYGLLAIIALSCFLPLVNTLAVSLSDRGPAEAGRVLFWPVQFSVASYRKLIEEDQFIRSFLISVERVLIGCTINFILTILTAYPLSKSKKEFPARNIMMWYVVAMMVFGAGLIPMYIIVSKLQLVNSIWALVIPRGLPIWNVILLMNFFRGVPVELEEAAIMDGAGPWYILFRIYLYISLPALATVTLFTIVGHWNSFFDGLIYMQNPRNYPLQTYIRQLTLIINYENIESMSPSELERIMEISNRTYNAAKIFISMIPILSIYPFLQKYFTKGIVLGAVKG
jgi:putative aldouronate transport system permease protein